MSWIYISFIKKYSVTSFNKGQNPAFLFTSVVADIEAKKKSYTTIHMVVIKAKAEFSLSIYFIYNKIFIVLVFMTNKLS